MTIESQEEELLVDTYSEFPCAFTPYHLDPASVLTAYAAAILHDNSPEKFKKVVLATNIHIYKKYPSPLIIESMENLMQDCSKYSNIPTHLDRSGTSTYDEIRAAKKAAAGLPLSALCMRYHRERVARNLKRELGIERPVFTTEDTLEAHAPEVLEPYREWLAGPEHQSRANRERIINIIDSREVGHFLIEQLNWLTGGRRINQALLRVA